MKEDLPVLERLDCSKVHRKTWRKHDADGADARALEREGVAMLIFGDYYRYASIQPTLVARGQEQAY